MSNTLAIESAVRNLIARSCLLLDEEKFDPWLGLWTPVMHYAIHAYSPEIRKDMTWLDLDRPQMTQLLAGLRTHERDPGALFRQPAVIEVRIDEAAQRANAITNVLVVRTSLHGESSLFAALRYHDMIALGPDGPLLEERSVRLSTRVLMSDSGGSHVPL